MGEPVPVLGDYELVELLADQGIAAEFLARARGESTPLELVRLGPAFAESCERALREEIRRARFLDPHPNVVRFIDAGDAGGAPFLVRERLEGLSFEDIARSGVDIEPRVAVELVRQAAAGMHAVHESRDQAGRPLEIVASTRSSRQLSLSRAGQVKVLAFGTVEALGVDLTHTGDPRLRFAPEAIGGKVALDRRSDVFILAEWLYELLVGDRMLQADDSIAWLIRLESSEPVPPIRTRRADLDADLERILDRALRKDREARTPSCAALEAELSTWLNVHGGKPTTPELAELVEHAAAIVPPTAPRPVRAEDLRGGPVRADPEPSHPERVILPALVIAAIIGFVVSLLR